jgi:hypothetical protein
MGVTVPNGGDTDSTVPMSMDAVGLGGGVPSAIGTMGGGNSTPGDGGVGGATGTGAVGSVVIGDGSVPESSATAVALSLGFAGVMGGTATGSATVVVPAINDIAVMPSTV